MIDAVEGLTAQDAHVAGYVVDEGKGLVVAVNKWDLVEEKTDRTFDQYVEWIRNEAPFLDFAPIVSISAKTGQRVGRVLEAAVEIWAERRRRIPTGELNRVLMAATRADAAAPGARPAPEVLLRDPGRDRAADVRVLRVGRGARPLHLPALPREPAARDVRVRRDADPPRVPGAGVGQAAAPQEERARRRSSPCDGPSAQDPPVALMAGPRVAVVGAGAWGTTLATIVAKREPVLLLCHREELAEEINRTQRNERGCPGSSCPERARRVRGPGGPGVAAVDLVIFATRRRTCARSRPRWGRTSPAERGRAVGRQGPRGAARSCG